MKKQNEGFWIRIGAIAACCLLTLGIILVLPSCTGSETTDSSGVTAVTMEVLNRPAIPIVSRIEPTNAPKYYGDRFSNNTPSFASIDPMSWCFFVTAQVAEVLPDTYVFYDEWAQNEYCLLKLKNVKVLIGQGVPEEFYYMLPAKYMTDFSIFDRLLIGNIAQRGWEYSVLYNQTQNKAEQFEIALFSPQSYFISGWSCMAFDENGDFDARLWNASDAWIEATDGDSAYATLTQAETDIRQAYAEWYLDDYLPLWQGFSGEAATALETIKSLENGLFIPNSSPYNTSFYAVRYINGFSTNEIVTLSRENSTDAVDTCSYTKARFSEDDMDRLPDLTSAYGAVIDALESGLITPPHFTRKDKASVSTNGVYGWYAKTENGVIGIIRVSWKFYSRGPAWNQYYDDIYYIIEYGSNECKALSRDALLQLLGDYESPYIYTGGYNEYGKYMDGTVPREE